MANSSVDRIYDRVRGMATDFEFKPEERINEGALASTLGVSRTPLREGAEPTGRRGLYHLPDRPRLLQPLPAAGKGAGAL